MNTACRPLLTVAICTHNHASSLERTLANLRCIDYPEAPWELLVIDNASTDGTGCLIRRTDWHLQNVPCRTAHESRLGVANARNRALDETTAEYVVFLDDDETPDRAWLQQMERLIETYRPDAIGGRIEVSFEGHERPPWLADELLGFLGRLDHGPDQRWLTEPSTPIFTGNAAFLRWKALAIGGFDAHLGRRGKTHSGGEDTDFYRRLVTAGGGIMWAPTALIHHRIEPWKLRRSYFLDLHYRQGRMEGSRKRSDQSCIPPKYLLPQIVRAFGRALGKRLREGANHSLRLEMNAAYFTGYMLGWMFDPT